MVALVSASPHKKDDKKDDAAQKKDDKKDDAKSQKIPKPFGSIEECEEECDARDEVCDQARAECEQNTKSCKLGCRSGRDFSKEKLLSYEL